MKGAALPGGSKCKECPPLGVFRSDDGMPVVVSCIYIRRHGIVPLEPQSLVSSALADSVGVGRRVKAGAGESKPCVWFIVTRFMAVYLLFCGGGGLVSQGRT
ncbi:unnamed protein product, partial [Phaeothamnion confervicola]